MSNLDDRIRRILAEMFSVAGGERQAFLDQACGDDARLKAEVLRMAAADTETGLPPWHEEPEPSPTPRLAPGKELAGRFRVVRFIATGGMGDVYEVEDLELSERVALKTIRPEVVGDLRMLSRFKREIQYAKRVTHPNVCRIHDLGSHREGKTEILFLTMELLHGETLADRLRTTGRIPPTEALSLVVQMAEGLAAAHEAGIIHRDFKTSNVMLTASNTGLRATVTDFGLARRSAAGDDASLTESGRVVGTPVYMAPEQLTNGELTPATDVYALGLVIYEMITGKRPFPGGTPDGAAMDRLTQPPPSPSNRVPGLDPRWETTIMRCLKREPARRFQGPKEVVLALTSADAPTKTLTTALMRGIRGARSPAAIAAVTALALLAGALSGLWILGRHRPSAAAVRWYEEGTRALRDGTAFSAMKAFERAVQLDAGFTLAHARLAEAATELDYMDKAESEMLRASPPAYQSFFLSADEKLRLDAIYFTLIKDFARAAAKYKDLAAKVGQAERAAALVDLGRAYESAGKIPEALATYSESAKRDGQFAAAFLRRGILEGKQQQTAKASADFDVAEQLYRTASKSEGLTEVLYQRSSLLRRTGKLAEARAPTEYTLEMARTNGDEYHQIRALLALSYLSYNSGDTQGGQQQAQRAVDLARQVGIDVLAASGLVDVGTALFVKGDNSAAEPYLRNALEIAKRFHAVRVEARAELTLGQVLAKEGRSEEAVEALKRAISDFNQVGEKGNASRAAVPLAGMLRNLGDYEAAGSVFRQQLQLAEQVKDDGGIAFAAQGLGSVLFIQERYTEALSSFDRSVAVGHAVGNLSMEGYSLANRGDVLWRLGRYPEAVDALNTAEALAQRLGGNKPLLANVYASRAEMDLSRQRLNEAEKNIHQMLDSAGQSPTTEASGKRLLGLVRVRAGRAREGIALCEESLQQAQATQHAFLVKNAELALAEAKLQAGDAPGAQVLAADLAQYFATKGQNESEFTAQALAGAACRSADRSEYAERAKTVLAKMRTSLGEGPFTGFASRPDIRKIIERVGLNPGIR